MSKKNIEAGEKKWQEAFNGGDASGVANIYAPNGRLLPPNSDILEGRSDIEGYVKGFVATGAQLRLTTFAVHEAPELCVAVGRYDMDIPTPDGPQKDNGKYVEVWGKQSDGSWLILDDIFNSSVPAPEA
jgi:uncharacterized protein (TIGR02246 family)